MPGLANQKRLHGATMPSLNQEILLGCRWRSRR